jgi:hypothetical protein
VPSSRSWTWRVHSGTRESWRALSGATCVRTPSSWPGSQWAIPTPTMRSMVFDVCPLRERRTQAQRLAELTQVDHGRFALAAQHGQAP